ncbi:MAG: hypothetical protein B9S32_07125 [Verrucomicrobia bacterium Tous-C9LFEB]|nr:MAG: hypothetical protein B9S32_07125 [Verrucomicrobia bacterium Tous-C9LFEB]
MEATLLAKRLRPKTYSIALYLAGLVLLVQVAAIFLVFYFRRVVTIDTSAPPLPNQAQVAQTPERPTPAPAVPSAPSASAPVQAATPPAPTPAAPARITPVPTPGRLAVAATEDPAQRVKALNEEAERFQTQGDLRLAALALFKAEALDSRDSTTLVNLARLMTLEKETDKARTYWQRVVDLGSAAGSNYNLAREQLVLIDSRSTGTSANNAPPATTVSAPVAPTTAVTATRALFVDRIEKTNTASNGSNNEFTMRVVLGAGIIPGGIQPGKVDIKLYFYDLQASGAIVPSRAQLKVNFLGSRQTWANGQRETLMATYLLSPDQARIYNQKYYGYMLRIYYDGKLQDERAEPDNLLKFFPAAN